MKRLISLRAFAVILGFGMATLPYASGEMAAPDSKTVKGDLLKIEGEFYTVHDTAGHEVRLHADKTSKPEKGIFKTGDKVEVQVTDKGHVLSVKHMQPAKQVAGYHGRSSCRLGQPSKLAQTVYSAESE